MPLDQMSLYSNATSKAQYYYYYYYLLMHKELTTKLLYHTPESIWAEPPELNP